MKYTHRHTQVHTDRGTSQVVLLVKSLPANAGDLRDTGSIHGSGRSPGGGHGIPLQYSCQGNPKDRGAWWAIIHGGCGESDMIEHTHTFCKLKHVMHTQGQQHSRTSS